MPLALLEPGSLDPPHRPDMLRCDSRSPGQPSAGLSAQRLELAVAEVVLAPTLPCPAEVDLVVVEAEVDLVVAGSQLLRSNLVENPVEIVLLRMVLVPAVPLLPAVLLDSAVSMTPWLMVVASRAVPLRLRPEPLSVALALEEPWPGQLWVVLVLPWLALWLVPLSASRLRTRLSLTRLSVPVSVAVPKWLQPWPSVLDTR